MLVTDNILSEDYADALQEAGESEESGSQFENFLKQASVKDIDLLR